MIEANPTLFREYVDKRYSPYIYEHEKDMVMEYGDGLVKRQRIYAVYAVWDDFNSDFDGDTSTNLDNIKGKCDILNLEWELYSAKLREFLT